MGAQYKRRTEGEYKPVMEAKRLVKECFRILSTEKLIPKRMRWLGADEVAKTAKAFKTAVYLANNTDANDPLTKVTRIERIRESHALLKTLSQLTDDLCDDIGFSHDKLTQWQKDVNAELARLSKWASRESNKGGG